MRSIDVTRDELIPLAEAARRFLPAAPGPACLWRWHAKGVRVAVRAPDGRTTVRRVRLETVKVGRARYTTAEAFRRFVEQANPDDAAGDESSPPTAIDARLEAAGLLR
ncbi:MAG TPA: hypothetical protein VF170_08075 [Planctomycetaceae bacterium]